MAEPETTSAAAVTMKHYVTTAKLRGRDEPDGAATLRAMIEPGVIVHVEEMNAGGEYARVWMRCCVAKKYLRSA